MRYNPGHPGARRDVFPLVAPRRKTLLYGFTSVSRVIGSARCRDLGLSADYWVPTPGDYYRFALTPQNVDGLPCSPGTPREVERLSRALEKGPLDAEEERYLIDLGALDAGRAELKQTAGRKSAAAGR